ncbi:MAG: formylmethanofuran dehydrogenase [Acidobacteria bacterium]|nr:formylmethanofuran dehydrogenase [Acidobacteriota bacterium]
MQSLDALLREAEVAHGHLCAGQILGVRMAMYACALLDVDDPRMGPDRKRLVTFVEIDRCATDAIGVVTGCRLGKRALKFVDYGKMAATFVDLHNKVSDDTYAALRVVALETSRELARQRFPAIENKNEQQMRAYRELSDGELFKVERVSVSLPANEFPGYKGGRVACVRCGEGINYARGVETPQGTICRACASPEARYYRPIE